MEFQIGQRVKLPDGKPGKIIKRQGNDYVARTYDDRLVGFDNRSPASALSSSSDGEEKQEGMGSSESTISEEGQREPLEDSGDKVSNESSNAGFLEENPTEDQKIETLEQKVEREAKEQAEALKIRERAKLERIRQQQEINE